VGKEDRTGAAEALAPALGTGNRDEWEERDALDTALDELTILEVALQTVPRPRKFKVALNAPRYLNRSLLPVI
jgi:hypothetical protein